MNKEEYINKQIDWISKEADGLAQAIKDNFEVPQEAIKVLDMLKPYQILANVFACKAEAAKRVGDKQKFEDAISSYNAINQQAIKFLHE